MSWAREWGKPSGICGECQELIPPERPMRSLYCCNACKQRAYRRRRAEGAAKPKKRKAKK